ncbi:MAG: serine hydrolase domain-containing protein [Granulosicoccus sp.]
MHDTTTAIDRIVQRAFDPVRQAIDDTRIPGAVLGAVSANGDHALRFAGMAQLEPHKRLMTEDTWFDLASLTKVLFTTPRILLHNEQKNLLLDDCLTRVLPDLQQYDSDSWIRQITFAQCLSHQTSLPAVEPIYTYGRDASLLRAFVLQRQWKKVTSVYSDINFILLGLALERLDGRRVWQMNPGKGFAFKAAPTETAATEYCTWRERVMCGEVHDDNCFALQGAGHAGLFGTARAVLDHALGLLNSQAYSANLIRTMRTPVGETRTYGWERAHSGWAGGSRCSSETIGHTGFTGTGLWIDFEAGLAWTLLTNRIHPTRHTDSGIDQLRRDVGESLFYS